MKFGIIFETSEYRGDHSADVCRIVEPLENETIENLIKRVGLLDRMEHERDNFNSVGDQVFNEQIVIKLIDDRKLG